MKQKIIGLMLLLSMCHICKAADGLRVEPFEIAPGETGKQVGLILDDAKGVYCGLEFWLYLPEGISISKKANGRFDYIRSEATEDHTFSIAQETDGSYHFLIYETYNTPLDNGVFCTLTLEASSTIEPGIVTGKFKKVVISDAQGQGPEFDEIPFTVTITGTEPTTVSSMRNYPFNAGHGSGVGIINSPLSIINYFDLKGRRIEGKPAKKGIYIRNGMKEVVR